MFNFIIGLVVGMGIVWVVIKKKGMDSRLRGNDKRKIGGEGGENPNEDKMEEKRRNLEKVLAMVDEKDEITNDDVEHALGVSNATAERYLQDLEQQGKLAQIGTTGQGVTYKLK